MYRIGSCVKRVDVHPSQSGRSHVDVSSLNLQKWHPSEDIAMLPFISVLRDAVRKASASSGCPFSSGEAEMGARDGNLGGVAGEPERSSAHNGGLEGEEHRLWRLIRMNTRCCC